MAFTMQQIEDAYQAFTRKHSVRPGTLKMNHLTWRDVFMREFPSGILPPESSLPKSGEIGHFKYAFKFRDALLEFDDTMRNDEFLFVKE